VEIIPTSLELSQTDKSSFDDGLLASTGLIRRLRDFGCDAVVVSGTPPFLTRGPDVERKWRDDLASELGIKVLTPMLSHIAALKALNVNRVGVATYYGPELRDSIRQYLARFGIEAAVFPGFTTAPQGSGLYATDLASLDGVGYQDVYRYWLLACWRPT
jgi:hypothetical protein